MRVTRFLSSALSSFCKPISIHACARTHMRTHTRAHNMFFDSQTFRIATGLLFLVKDSAVEICSISCCVCQGPGTLVAMETNIQPLGGTFLSSCIWAHFTVPYNAAASPFKMGGGRWMITNLKKNAISAKAERDLNVHSFHVSECQ